jgi:hypothetical protein
MGFCWLDGATTISHSPRQAGASFREENLVALEAVATEPQTLSAAC